MITTISDLRDATAFERMAIEAASTRGVGTVSIDIEKSRAAGVVVREHTSHVRIAQSDVDAAFDKVRPLLFGAACKCLDLAVEYGLHSAGERPDGGKREYSIAEKTRRALQAASAFLAKDAAVWTRIAEVFEKTEEVRHSLVHRKFELAPGSGAMTGMGDRNGDPIDDLTNEHQSAFGHLALLTFEVFEHGTLDSRLRAAIVYQLDRLCAIHKQPVIGNGIRERKFPRIIVTAKATTRYLVNLLEAKRAMSRDCPNERFVVSSCGSIKPVRRICEGDSRTHRAKRPSCWIRHIRRGG